MSAAPLSLQNPFVICANIPSRAARRFKKALRALQRTQRIHAAYLHLRELDDYLLRDIGLSRGDLYGAVRGRRD